MVEAVDDIAVIMTMECGKPLAESKAECAGGYGHTSAVLNQESALLLIIGYLGTAHTVEQNDYFIATENLSHLSTGYAGYFRKDRSGVWPSSFTWPPDSTALCVNCTVSNFLK